MSLTWKICLSVIIIMLINRVTYPVVIETLGMIIHNTDIYNKIISLQEAEMITHVNHDYIHKNIFSVIYSTTYSEK